jgi:DNA-binding MurR/RpiR family transcriptional regulator
MQFLQKIEAALATMRPSEADVARRLLREPNRIASQSLREVAAWCDTSDATVLRTCRAAGFDGYQDLKYHVLRALTTGGGATEASPHADSLAWEDIQASLRASESSLPKAARLLARARQVAIVGWGASSGVGTILAEVLCTLGRPALPLPDDQAVDFALATPRGRLALVAISHSGETSFPLRAVRAAQEARVATIGLTNAPASELGRLVDVLLSTQVVERPAGSFSIVPRLCQLAVLEQLTDHLRRQLVAGSTPASQPASKQSR